MAVVSGPAMLVIFVTMSSVAPMLLAPVTVVVVATFGRLGAMPPLSLRASVLPARAATATAARTAVAPPGAGVRVVTAVPGH